MNSLFIYALQYQAVSATHVKHLAIWEIMEMNCKAKIIAKLIHQLNEYFLSPSAVAFSNDFGEPHADY